MNLRYSLVALRGALCLCLVTMTVGTAQAAWDLVPEIGLLVEHNDNPRLRTGGETNASRTIIDATLDIRNFGERGEIRLRPRIRADQYSDAVDEELENDDAFLRGSGEYRWQRATIGFTSNYVQQSILSSETPGAAPDDPDLDDPSDDITGNLIFFDQVRTRTVFRPYMEFQLTERTGALLETEITESTYTGPQFSSRTDYTNDELALGLVRRVDDLTRMTARVVASKYEAVQNMNVTDSVGVEGVFSRPLSDLWTLNIAAGMLRSDFAFMDADDNLVDNADANVTFDLGFRRRTDFSRININVFREISPSASGHLSQQNQVRIYLERQWSDRFSAWGAVRGINTKSLDNSDRFNDRDYFRLEMGLDWHFTARWFFSLGYSHTLRERQNRPDSEQRESNSYYLGINFRGLSNTDN